MPDQFGKVQGILTAEKNIPHGVFNSLAVNKNPKKQIYDDTGFDPFSSLKEELTKKYTPDVFDMKAEWNAIVLKVIDPKDDFSFINPIFSAIDTLLSDPVDSSKKDVIRFVGRIPELHGCLLLPDGPNDDLVFSMYPVFEGGAALGKPSAGDIVRVTFDNLNNFSGPKYIGPITSPSAVAGLGVTEEQPSPKQAFVNTPKGRRTSLPQINDLNTDPNRIGHPANKGFPKTLTNIDKSKFPHVLYDRARARGFDTDLVPVPEISIEQHINVYISVAASEVIEQYWRQQYPDATVMIIFNVRNSRRDKNNSHGIGAAIDFVVHTGGTTIPVLQTWAALTRLAEAGRLPFGGRGVYLNVAQNGIKGVKPEECGEASPGQGQHKSNLPQGGSAGIHYDWRDSFGNQRGPRGGIPNKWVSIDIKGSENESVGDGHDEYELGQWQTIKTANTEAGDPLLADNSNLRPGYTREEAHPDYVKVYLRQKLPSIYSYWSSNGKYDETLPPVGPKVFNLLQVLELEQ